MAGVGCVAGGEIIEVGELAWGALADVGDMSDACAAVEDAVCGVVTA